MKVFMGCEESGVGRRAFQAQGHYVLSCDLQPARDGSLAHHQGDVVELLKSFPDQYFDIGVFHPDCTKMCVAGNRYHAGTKGRVDQVAWTVMLWRLAKLKCRRVAFENPASVMFGALRPLGADVQYVQPWQHGHMEQKKTGFALYQLPRIAETNNVYEEMMRLPKSQRERIFYMSPGENRSRDRSESYSGIMNALAEQWTRFVEQS